MPLASCDLLRTSVDSDSVSSIDTLELRCRTVLPSISRIAVQRSRAERETVVPDPLDGCQITGNSECAGIKRRVVEDEKSTTGKENSESILALNLAANTARCRSK